jgi:hypothetical protein
MNINVAMSRHLSTTIFLKNVFQKPRGHHNNSFSKTRPPRVLNYRGPRLMDYWTVFLWFRCVSDLDHAFP